MNIETKRLQNELGILFLSGSLDSASLKNFKSKIRELVSDGVQDIIVDCRELGFISSSGLAALLWVRSTVGKAGAKVYMTHVTAVVNEVLQVTKLSRLFLIEPTTKGLLERLGRIRKPTDKGTRKSTLASSLQNRRPR